MTLAQRVESVIADSKGATNEHQSKLVKDCFNNVAVLFKNHDFVQSYNSSSSRRHVCF